MTSCISWRLQDWLKSGLLTRLDVAFSRDQPEKRYVQHALWDARRDLYAWLKDGAALYVCGDANAMAKDVHAMLLRILADQGGQDEAGGEGRTGRDPPRRPLSARRLLREFREWTSNGRCRPTNASRQTAVSCAARSPRADPRRNRRAGRRRHATDEIPRHSISRTTATCAPNAASSGWRRRSASWCGCACRRVS